MAKSKSLKVSEGALASMTGFGAGSARNDNVSLEIEIRSVNSRFLDPSIRMPKIYAKFEAGVRELISSFVHRGRVEVYVNRFPISAEACGVLVNQPLLAAYTKAYESIFSSYDALDREARLRFLPDILSRNDVLVLNQDEELAGQEEEVLQQALREALKRLTESRCVEGKKIAVDLEHRVSSLEQLRESIATSSAGAPASLKAKLEERLEKLNGEIALDPDRLSMEAAIVADRIDVTEELVRLESHLLEFRSIMKQPPNGRKLEFMLQEIAREFNTVGSKTNCADVPRMVVEAKSEIEKLKEQIQNVE